MSPNTVQLVQLIEELRDEWSFRNENSERVQPLLDEISRVAADMVSSGEASDIPSVKAMVEVLSSFPPQEHDTFLLLLTDISGRLFQEGRSDAADWLIAAIADMLADYSDMANQAAPTELAPISWTADRLLALNYSIGNISRRATIGQFASQAPSDGQLDWAARHVQWHEDLSQLMELGGMDGAQFQALYDEAPDNLHRALAAAGSPQDSLIEDHAEGIRKRVASGNSHGVAEEAALLAPALRSRGRHQVALELVSAGLLEFGTRSVSTGGQSTMSGITEGALLLEAANIRIASAVRFLAEEGRAPPFLYKADLSRLLRAAAARLLVWRSASADPFVRAHLPTRGWRRPLIAGLVSVNDVAAAFTVIEAFHSNGVANVVESNSRLLKPGVRSALVEGRQHLEGMSDQYLVRDDLEHDWVFGPRSAVEASTHAKLRKTVGGLLSEVWSPELMTVGMITDEIADGTAFLQGYDFANSGSFFGACVVLSAENSMSYLVGDSTMRKSWTNWRTWVQYRDEDQWSNLSRALLPECWVTGASAVPERLVVVGSGAFAAVPWALLPVASGRLGEVTDLINAPSIRLWKCLPKTVLSGGTAVFVGLEGRDGDPNEVPEARVEYAALKEAGFQIHSASSLAEFRSLAERSDLALLTLHGATPKDGMNRLRFPNGEVIASPELLTVEMPPITVIGSCWSGALIDDPLPLNLVSTALIAGTRALVVGAWPDVQSPAMAGVITRLLGSLSQGHTVARALRDARTKASPYERAAAAGLLAVARD